MKNMRYVVALLVICLTWDGWAQNEPNMGNVRNLGTRITGNQEQPKVLYIVPWKSGYDDTAIGYRPVVGQTDSVFQHVERHEHQRHLNFLEEFTAEEN